MDPAVYNVLKRLAPPSEASMKYLCLSHSKNVPLFYNGQVWCSLVCTLTKGHNGYHVAHAYLSNAEEAIDIWE